MFCFEIGFTMSDTPIQKEQRGVGFPFNTMWYLDPSSHLATTDMGRKLRPVPFLGELDAQLTQCGRGRGLPPCEVSS